MRGDPVNSLRVDLTELAVRVGSVLNIVQDDDDREKLQQHFERVLNDELYAGSRNREMVADIWPNNVIDLSDYSKKVAP
jgi:hypothetical protein